MYLSVMNVNLCGAVRCIQAVLPQMRERGSGTIVNISSVAGRIAALAQSPYVASKWAFEGLSEGLAQEFAPFGIRVVDHRAGRDQVGDLREERRRPELDRRLRSPLPPDVPVLRHRHGERDRPVRGRRR
jgi:NAD(P)-dependent dehydrogenase (short-subunit alcohol dehydrogenase family)